MITIYYGNNTHKASVARAILISKVEIFKKKSYPSSPLLIPYCVTRYIKINNGIRL